MGGEGVVVKLAGLAEVAAFVSSDEVDVEGFVPLVVGVLVVGAVSDVDAEWDWWGMSEFGDGGASPFGVLGASGSELSPLGVSGWSLGPVPSLWEEEGCLVGAHGCFFVGV